MRTKKLRKIPVNPLVHVQVQLLMPRKIRFKRRQAKSKLKPINKIYKKKEPIHLLNEHSRTISFFSYLAEPNQKRKNCSLFVCFYLNVNYSHRTHICLYLSKSKEKKTHIHVKHFVCMCVRVVRNICCGCVYIYIYVHFKHLLVKKHLI